jgi:hypothetical protein
VAESSLDSDKVREAMLSGATEAEALNAAGIGVVVNAEDVPSWFAKEILNPVDYPNWEIFTTSDYSTIGVLERLDSEKTASVDSESPKVIDVLVAKGWTMQKGGDGIYSGFKDSGEMRWCFVGISESNTSRMNVISLYNKGGES